MWGAPRVCGPHPLLSVTALEVTAEGPPLRTKSPAFENHHLEGAQRLPEAGDTRGFVDSAVSPSVLRVGVQRGHVACPEVRGLLPTKPRNGNCQRWVLPASWDLCRLRVIGGSAPFLYSPAGAEGTLPPELHPGVGDDPREQSDADAGIRAPRLTSPGLASTGNNCGFKQTGHLSGPPGSHGSSFPKSQSACQSVGRELLWAAQHPDSGQKTVYLVLNR